MFYSLQLGLAASFKDLNFSALSKIGMYDSQTKGAWAVRTGG